MNLGELRQAAYDILDWSPTESPEAKARFSRFVRRATDILMQDAPFLFFETIVQFTTEPDVIPTLATDTLTLATANVFPAPLAASTTEPWVFITDLILGTTDAVVWPIDRSWDGRMLEIRDAANPGIFHRLQIRTVQKVALQNDFVYHISVTQPWDSARYGTGPFTYRIFTTEYALPDETVEVNSIRFYDTGQNYPLTPLNQLQAEDLAYELPRDQATMGPPDAFYRRKHIKIAGPGQAPLAASEAAPGLGPPITYWMGPDPIGKFTYKLTYTWGKRDVLVRNQGLSHFAGHENPWEFDASSNFAPGAFEIGTNRGREPRWESAPSPASDEVTPVLWNPGQGDNFAAIKITIPNIEHALGFDVTGLNVGGAVTRQSTGMSGWHVRIWRKRTTADFTGYNNLDAATPGGTKGTNLNVGNRLEYKEDYFLLGEVKIDQGNNGVFYDRGEIIPDYNRRLRDIHGYETLQFYPLPNDRYEVDVRVIQRPRIAVDDSDTIELHAEAMEVLIARVVAFGRAAEGDITKKKDALKDYQRQLKLVKKRYGLMIPDTHVIMKRPGRAFRRYRGLGRRWWLPGTP